MPTLQIDTCTRPQRYSRVTLIIERFAARSNMSSPARPPTLQALPPPFSPTPPPPYAPPSSVQPPGQHPMRVCRAHARIAICFGGAPTTRRLQTSLCLQEGSRARSSWLGGCRRPRGGPSRAEANYAGSLTTARASPTATAIMATNERCAVLLARVPLTANASGYETERAYDYIGHRDRRRVLHIDPRKTLIAAGGMHSMQLVRPPRSTYSRATKCVQCVW